MIALDTIRTLAQALPGTEEAIHFKLVVFGVRKRNYASFNPRTGEFSLRLPAADPSRTAALAQGLATPVPGKYGADGWATIALERISQTEFVALLETAHRDVSAPVAKPARKIASASKPRAVEATKAKASAKPASASKPKTAKPKPT